MSSLLLRLDPVRRLLLKMEWGMFDHSLRSYAFYLVGILYRGQRSRRGGITVVERWLANPIPEGLEAWQADRVAASGYHWLGEFERAARHLRASLIEHLCQKRSCEHAPDALLYLYLRAGLGLEAVLTAASIPHALQLSHFVDDLVGAARIRRLVDELVADHRGAPAELRLPATLGELDSPDANAASTALTCLRAWGAAMSPALRAALPTCGPRARERVEDLLVQWAIARGARRFWTPPTPVLPATQRQRE